MMGHAEKIWLFLVTLTFTSVLLAETGHAGWPLTILVALLIGVKGGAVIEHYMEMRLANRRFRRILLFFVTLVPILVLLTHGWGDTVRRLTTLG